MATGGSSGNFKLMGKYAEHGADYLASSTTSMGEGLRMMSGRSAPTWMRQR